MQNLRENLIQAQSRMKFFADQKREEREFQVGEMVYLKLQPFRQNSVYLRKNLKLSYRYYGPYKIPEKIGKVAYKLDLPESSKIYPVFHVSLLKKYVGKEVVPVQDLPEVDVDFYHIAPFQILCNRMVQRHGIEIPQILVHWLNSTTTAATWEDYVFIRCKFPTFDPCGQGSSSGKDIVMAARDLEVEGLLEKEGKGKELGFIRKFGGENGVFGGIGDDKVK